MLITAEGFSALLRSLNLTEGLFKSVGTTGPSSTVGIDAVNGTYTSLTEPVPPQSSPSIFSDPTYLGKQPLLPRGNSLVAIAPATQIMDQSVPSCQVNDYDVLVPVNQPFSPFDQASASIFRYRQQQTVNLGSWFVHEQWMTPSLFTCASGKQLSELDIASGWGSTANARAILEHHWDTFINQSDFDYLASIGINTVRLPIGYWSLGPSYCKDTPFADVADVYQNSWNWVLQAINMANQAGIGVLLDLHGAVGSQNGQPHSGISDGQTNLFSDPENMTQTIAVLLYLVEQLGSVTNMVGIQLLNEPQNAPQLIDFYSRAISSIRELSPAAAIFPLYIHDAFDLKQFSTYIANRTDFVVQDHHSYFVYTPSDEAEPADQHTSDIGSAVADSLSQASAQQHRNLVVDEWSCALTPQSLANEAHPQQSQKAFCTEQMEVYANSTAGWGFWSYAKEDCSNDPGWCFKAAVGTNLPATFFSYGQCTASNSTQFRSLPAIVANMPLPPVTDVMANAQQYSPPAASVSFMSAPSTDEYMSSTAWSGPLPTYSFVPSSPPLVSLPFKRKVPRYQHRLASIHSRRQTPPDGLSEYDGLTMTPGQVSVAKGYSDGFLTAKIFAASDMSKLGFVGQYIDDSIKVLGFTVIAAGTEDYYTEWFMKGLEDGQALISAAISSLQNVPT